MSTEYDSQLVVEKGTRASPAKPFESYLYKRAAETDVEAAYQENSRRSLLELYNWRRPAQDAIKPHGPQEGAGGDSTVEANFQKAPLVGHQRVEETANITALRPEQAWSESNGEIQSMLVPRTPPPGLCITDPTAIEAPEAPPNDQVDGLSLANMYSTNVDDPDRMMTDAGESGDQNPMEASNPDGMTPEATAQATPPGFTVTLPAKTIPQVNRLSSKRQRTSSSSRVTDLSEPAWSESEVEVQNLVVRRLSPTKLSMAGQTSVGTSDTRPRTPVSADDDMDHSDGPLTSAYYSASAEISEATDSDTHDKAINLAATTANDTTPRARRVLPPRTRRVSSKRQAGQGSEKTDLTDSDYEASSHPSTLISRMAQFKPTPAPPPVEPALTVEGFVTTLAAFLSPPQDPPPATSSSQAPQVIHQPNPRPVVNQPHVFPDPPTQGIKPAHSAGLPAVQDSDPIDDRMNVTLASQPASQPRKNKLSQPLSKLTDSTQVMVVEGGKLSKGKRPELDPDDDARRRQIINRIMKKSQIMKQLKEDLHQPSPRGSPATGR
ncbi:hypothetical protein FRB99_003644 [Tulasnella sp. 403]|nr:hypothetical protein FRB99_003644 [Tulasnella sp. 403]